MILNILDLVEKVSSKVRFLDFVKVGYGYIGYYNYDYNNIGNLMIILF